LIDLKMGLASDQDTDPLGQSGLQLFVKLVDTDSVTEIEDGVVIWLAAEHDGDVQGHEDVVVGWTSSHWELVGDVLLGDQELDLSPWETENETTLLLDVVELAMLRDHSVGTLWHIDIWVTTGSLGD
jgi:hypothetical protein